MFLLVDTDGKTKQIFMLFQCAFIGIELEICFLVLGTCIEVGNWTVSLLLNLKKRHYILSFTIIIMDYDE